MAKKIAKKIVNKKKRGGEGEHNDVGIYEFDNDVDINFFSDLEGNMPQEIEELTGINENGIIKPLANNRVLVFTGDLIDRGEMSIRNLKSMLKLKQNYPYNVILACGNRDLNKIRCVKEFWIAEIFTILKDENNMDKSIEYIFNIIKKSYKEDKTKFNFKYLAKDIKADINIHGIYIKKDFEEEYSDELVKRVNFIYKNTYGAQKQIEFFKSEFLKLFNFEPNIFKDDDAKLDDDYANPYICLFIAMMNMIMGNIWGDDVKIPKVFIEYKGLYIEYLKKCHIMAKITIGDKFIFASHSGVPFNNNMFMIPSTIGFEPQNKTLHINIKNIKILNREFANFLINFCNYYNYVISEKVPINYKKGLKEMELHKMKLLKTSEIDYKNYIAISAACLNHCDNYYTYYPHEHSNSINSSFSPIVTINSLDDKGPLKYKNIPIILDSEYDKFKKIYNIFGHQPAGLLPSFSTAENKEKMQKTFHIDLDISRAENMDKSNTDSYVYLQITADDDRFIGKTIVAMRDVYELSLHDDNKLRGIIKTDKITIPHEPPASDKTSYNVTLDDEKPQLYHTIIKEYNTTTKATVIDDIGDQATIEQDISYPVILHSIDGQQYYGMCSQNFHLLTYYNTEQIVTGGRSNKYKKSEKRFINGKRKMVIYTGKRGGEYVKVKGAFISLVKYKKFISKAVKKAK